MSVPTPPNFPEFITFSEDYVPPPPPPGRETLHRIQKYTPQSQKATNQHTRQ